jgi:hypothetical protein
VKIYVYGFSSHCNKKVGFWIVTDFKRVALGFRRSWLGRWGNLFEPLGEEYRKALTTFIVTGVPIMRKIIPMQVNPA